MMYKKDMGRGGMTGNHLVTSHIFQIRGFQITKARPGLAGVLFSFYGRIKKKYPG